MPQLDFRIEVKDTDKSVQYSLEADKNGEITLRQFANYLKSAMIQIALNNLKEEQAKGFEKNPVVIVDNRVGKDLSQVKPFGKIEFKSSQVEYGKVLEDIYAAILERSKVVTGTYIEGNIVIHKTTVVATNMAGLKAWLKSNPNVKPGDNFRFVNVVPYARKLERFGVTAQRSKTRTVKTRDKQKRSGETVLAANGTYYLASRSAIRAFKGNVFIYFGFIQGTSLGLQSVPTISKKGKELRRTYAPKKGQDKNKKTGPYLYPYIKVIIGESGVKL